MLWAGILLVIIGAVEAFWPELSYSLFESWKHRDDSGEPSDAYLFRSHVGGILAMLAGAVLILLKIF